jgi:alpha-glucosidase (family GH31 glycosyl hydrolase)
MLDITNPGAQEWLWEQFDRLISEGVDGLWIDLTEPEYTIENGQFFLGPEEKVHNIYNNLFAETIYKGWRKDIPGKRVFNLTRAGFAGIQRYGAVNWSGDASKTWIALELQVPMLIGCAMSGMPHYSSDIGGFTNAHDRTDGLTIFTNYDGKGVLTTPELYIRWFQFGVFSPMLRPHSGEEQYCEPFAHGPQAEKISSFYLNWRYKLIPYLYTYAHKTTAYGEQLIKPLFMQYDDKNCDGIDYQYMFGNQMMVAPVLKEDIKTQEVYFPKLKNDNKWISFWNDKAYNSGQKSEVNADLETIPVFVPQPSILPVGKLKKHVGESPDDTITWRIYPGGAADFTLYEDDGQSYAYEKNEYATTSISTSIDKDDLSIKLDPIKGNYDNMITKRTWFFDVRLLKSFDSIIINGKETNDYQYDKTAHKLTIDYSSKTSKPVELKITNATLIR